MAARKHRRKIMKFLKAFWQDVVSRGSLYVTGQIIGLVAIFFAFFIYTQKDRNKLVVCKLIADIMNVFQHAFSGTYAGAATGVVMCFRDTVFIFRGKKKWAEHIAWLYVFEAFIFLSPMVTSSREAFSLLWFIDFLPAVASGFATVGLYNKNVVTVRLFSLVGTTLTLIYVSIFHNYVPIVSNVISITSTFIGLAGDIHRKKQAKKQEEFPLEEVPEK